MARQSANKDNSSLAASGTIHVLQVASGDLWAGAESQVAELSRALSRRRDTRVSAFLMNPGRLADELSAIGLDVHVADERTESAARILKHIVAVARASSIDVIHTHRQKENILGGLAGRILGIPTIRTVHGGRESAADRQGWRERVVHATDDWAARHLQNRVISVSRELTHREPRRFPPGKSEVIANGIDPEAIRAQAGDGPPFAEDYRGWSLVYAGRLVPVKRVDRILEAVEALGRSAETSVRLRIVGDGPERSALEDRARELGIAPRVEFLGHRHDALRLIGAADALVLASEHEGLPMTILEALSLGVPPVAPPVGAIPEVLSAAAFGRVAESADPRAIGRAIEDLLASRQRGPRVSRLPRAWHIETTAEMYRNNYAEIRAERPGRPFRSWSDSRPIKQGPRR